MLSFTACGTQVNTLRAAVSRATGVAGVPPELTSLAVVEASPTNASPLDLNWGLVVGNYTHYCILENSIVASGCVWRSGALPATYADSAGDGPLQLSAYLRNEYGNSHRIDANAITLDRTAPDLASLAITNASPTNSQTYGLAYGAFSGGAYTEHCWLENDTDVSHCAWTAGALPASVSVSATNNAKEISVWIRDAVGNRSPRIPSATSVTLDTVVPQLASASVTNSSPTATTTFGLNFGAVSDGPYSHFCILENDTDVSHCAWTAGALPASFSVANVSGGKVLSIWIRDSAGNVSTRDDTASVVYDNGMPGVTITTPLAGAYVNAANVTAVAATGTCSENGQIVQIAGAASATPTCTAGAWSATLDFSAAAAGSVTLLIDHENSFGTAAPQVTRAVTKDVIAPSLALGAPNGGETIANVATYAVTFTASDATTSVASIAIDYSTNGGSSWTSVATGLANTSPYTWTLPAVETAQGRVRITAVDAAGNSVSDASDADFAIDSVAPSLASATITNANPTTTTTYALTYGAVTGSYAEYCILENDTTIGNCAWVAGTLPASKTVTAVDEAKTLSVWIRDAAGNASARVDTAAITLDRGPNDANTLIAATSPILADGTTTSTVTITVKDAANAALVGVTPVIAVTGTGNTVSACSASDASGVSTCTVASTVGESKTVSITSPAGMSKTATIVFMSSPPAGAGHSTIAVAAGTADDASAITVTITLLDASDNPVPGVTPAFEILNGAGTYTITSACGATNVSGVSTCAFRTYRGDRQIFRVTAPAGLSDVMTSPTITCASAATYFGAAAGTVGDPYVIDTVRELDQVRCRDGYYSIAADLDLSSTQWLTPPTIRTIGLEGNDHTLTGLNVEIDFPVYYANSFNLGGASFLGRSPTTLASLRSFRNLNFASPVVRANGLYNASYRHAGVVSYQTSLRIEDVHVTNATVHGSGDVGGIVGRLVGGAAGADTTKQTAVLDSSVTGLITADSFGDHYANYGVGGIAGRIQGTGALVKNNLVTATVDGGTAPHAQTAGLVGHADLDATNTGEPYAIEDNRVLDSTIFGFHKTAGLIAQLKTRGRNGGSDLESPRIAGNYVRDTEVSSVSSNVQPGGHDIGGFAAFLTGKFGGDYLGKEIIVERNAFVGGRIAPGHETCGGMFGGLYAPASVRDNYVRGTIMRRDGRGFGLFAAYAGEDHSDKTNVLFEMKRNYVSATVWGTADSNVKAMFGGGFTDGTPALDLSSDDNFYDLSLMDVYIDDAPMADNGLPSGDFKTGTPFAGWSSAVWDFVAGSYPRLKNHPNTLSAAAPVRYLADDFDDNALSESMWNTAPYELNSSNFGYPNAPNVVETGQRLEFTVPNDGKSYGVATEYAYDLTGAYVAFELVQPADTNSYVETDFKLSAGATDDNGYWGFYVTNPSNNPVTAIFHRTCGGSYHQQDIAPYSAINHRHLRIRHDSGTDTLRWETSPDGVSWTEVYSLARGGCRIEGVRAAFLGGWNYGATTATVLIDNVTGTAVRNY